MSTWQDSIDGEKAKNNVINALSKLNSSKGWEYLTLYLEEQEDQAIAETMGGKLEQREYDLKCAVYGLIQIMRDLPSRLSQELSANESVNILSDLDPYVDQE